MGKLTPVLLLPLVLLVACQAKAPKGPPGPLAGVVITGVEGDADVAASQVSAPCQAAETLLAQSQDGQVRGHRLVALSEECVKRGSDRAIGQALLGYGLEQIGQPRQGLQALKNLLSFSNAASSAANPNAARARVLGYEARSYFYAGLGRWADAVDDLNEAMDSQPNPDPRVTGALMARRGFYQSLAASNPTGSDQPSGVYALAAESSFEEALARWQAPEAANEVAFQRGMGHLANGRWEAASLDFSQVFETAGRPYRQTQAMLLAYYADYRLGWSEDQSLEAARATFEARAAQANISPALAPFVALFQDVIGPEAALGKAEANPNQNIEASQLQAYWYIGIYHQMRDEHDLVARAWNFGLSTRVITLQDYFVMQAMSRRFGV
ncbi:MAG: hypothetical protein RIC87_07185 [Kiloniellales bacterium]